jgi:hypothetical protein
VGRLAENAAIYEPGFFPKKKTSLGSGPNDVLCYSDHGPLLWVATVISAEAQREVFQLRIGSS